MIVLLLDPPRFECATADEAAALAKLMGIGPAPVVLGSCSTVTTERPKLVIPIVPPLAAPVRRAKGRMRPTGKLKTCKKCGGDFPVADRSDCAAAYCRACRPAPAPRRKPRLPMPAAVKPAKATAKPGRNHAEPVSCSTCGASVPEFESIDGECLQCAPLVRRKSA